MAIPIPEAVQTLAGSEKFDRRATLIVADVLSVNETKKTCVVKEVWPWGGVQWPDVVYKTSSGSGEMSTPQVGSQVLMLFQTNGDAYIIGFAELDKKRITAAQQISFHAGTGLLPTLSSVKLTPDSIVSQVPQGGNVTLSKSKTQLNDGSYGGLAIVEAVARELNALREEVNTIKAAITAQAPIDSPIKAQAVLSSLTTWGGQLLTPVPKSELENTDVTHGKI
ncbi:MAG: hypothetical protein EOP56_09450 [Sphingobacteriales bacterium]|nr:MAG: hypothetical protein EOP56_09450 [Sphingobacteriales bacterium]